MPDAMFKVVFFGDGGVGKTTLINRYVTGVFKSDSIITIGVDFHVKKIEIEGKRVSLQIWDFAGEDRFRFLLPSYVIGASGGIFMFDITRYTSLKNFNDWLEIIKQGHKRQENQIPVLMVGSKLDLEYKRTVSADEAFELAKKHDLKGYIECSAKDGRNVHEIFQQIGRIMMQQADLL
ncbi:MAG: Rab family GTPase [Candidatus Hodarchaeota archaeon]